MFGKEVILKRTVSVLFIVILLSIPSGLFSLTLKVNGVERYLSPASLEGTARLRPAGGVLERTVVLEELLPVFRSVRSVRVTGNNGTIALPLDGEEGLELYRSHIIPRTNAPGFILSDGRGGRLISAEGVDEIQVEGELLENRRLEVWVSWEGVRELKDEIARWGELHGIDVTVNEVPKSDSKLLSVLRGGDVPPDVILIQSDYLSALTAANALQPMVRFPLEGFSEKGIGAFTLESRLWAAPFYLDTQLLFYRSDLVDLSAAGTAEGGRGWTLETFEAEARNLKERGISPASWNAYSAYWLAPFQIGFGKPSIVESDGSVTVNDRATVEAVHYLKRVADEGLLDLRERDSMFSRFISGDVAMMLSGSFSIPELARIGVPFEVVPYPRGPRGPVAPFLDFKGFAVTRKTRNPLLARRFILSMSDPALQHEFTSQVYKLPASESAWQLTERENPYYAVLRASFDSGIPVPPDNGYKIYKNTMWKMLRLLLTGSLPVEAGLDQAQKLIDNQMAR